MSQVSKYDQATALLKELNCPETIMDMLFVWGMTVRQDEIKLHNWKAMAEGNLVEGECIGLPIETIAPLETQP